MSGVLLNLGCGRDIRPGWVNVDSHAGDGVDLVVDLDRPGGPVFPQLDNSVDHSEGSHVIEHLHRPLPMMAELWRVTKPCGTAEFRCPYGSSDDADEDPTHVRRLFAGSWGYFGQPFYWRADYGYRADWHIERLLLRISPDFARATDDELPSLIRFSRNVVLEMIATLVAVKPARPPRRELQQQPVVEFERLVVPS